MLSLCLGRSNQVAAVLAAPPCSHHAAVLLLSLRASSLSIPSLVHVRSPTRSSGEHRLCLKCLTHTGRLLNVPEAPCQTQGPGNDRRWHTLTRKQSLKSAAGNHPLRVSGRVMSFMWFVHVRLRAGRLGCISPWLSSIPGTHVNTEEGLSWRPCVCNSQL